MMTAYWTMYRSFTSSLLWPSIANGLEFQFEITAFAMPLERVKRPGGSHEGVGKKPAPWRLGVPHPAFAAEKHY